MNVLVIALDDAGPEPAAGDQVLVVAPLLNSRLRHWFSDDGEARRTAATRLEAVVGRLQRAGISARGEIGDADPVQAIADALAAFAADEVVVSARAERLRPIAEQTLMCARIRFAVPVLSTADLARAA